MEIKGIKINWDNFSVWVYVVLGNEVALIDSGPPSLQKEEVMSIFSRFGVSLGKTKWVLNTHGHVDHIGANDLVRMLTGAKVLIHEKDAIFIEDRSLSFDLYYAPGKENYALVKEEFLKIIGPDSKADAYVKEGDMFDLGGVTVKVLELPGHTLGSVGYWIEKEGIVFCGDSIQGLGSGGLLPIIYDLDQYELSVRKVMELEAKIAYFSHPYRGEKLPPSTSREGDELKRFLTDSLGFCKVFREAIYSVTSGNIIERELFHITKAIVEKLPPEMEFLPLSVPIMRDFSCTTVYFTLKNLKLLKEEVNGQF
ncbi:MAG: MBL fold metallo-hydrolase [candidate division WOR-3 bacterium]